LTFCSAFTQDMLNNHLHSSKCMMDAGIHELGVAVQSTSHDALLDCSADCAPY